MNGRRRRELRRGVAFAAGHYHAMPVIVGSNADEGTNFVAAWPIKDRAAYHGFVAENFGTSGEAALKQYPIAHEGDVLPRVAEQFADTQFNYGVWALARAMAKSGKGVWRYLFLKRRSGQSDGPHHGDEVPFVFGVSAPSRKGAAFDAGDQALSEVMMKLWVQFARNGDPNRAGVAWSAYDAADDNYLELGDTVRPGAGWRRYKMEFLDQFFAGKAG
jgi:para-nitrobenzyl esterase